jgi:hypothetical protein
MDETSQHFLAGAGFAGDQYRAIARRDATSQLGEPTRGVGEGDHVIGGSD